MNWCWTPHALQRTRVYAGLEWRQVPFVTQFSPFFDPDHPNPDRVPQSGSIGLGHGRIGQQALAKAFDQMEREGYDIGGILRASNC